MLTSGFYNSKGGDRKYDAEQFGAMFNGLITDGVFAHYKDALKVTAGSGNRELVVKPGRAWFNGTWTEVDDNNHSIYLMGSAVEATYFVYLAVNKLDRKNTIAWYANIANNDPEKGLYFYLLAQVTVPGGVTKISDSMITDTRGSDLCPYVTGVMETVSFEEIVKRVCGGSWQDWLGVYEAGITTGVQNAVATSERALDEVKSMKAYVVESEAVSYIWAKFEAVPTGGGGFEWATDAVHTELFDPPMPMFLFRDLSYADLGPGFKPNVALNSPYIAEGEAAAKAIPAVTQSKVWREYPYFWEGGADFGTEVLRYDDLQRVVVNVGGIVSEKYRYRVSRLMHIPVVYEPGAYIGTVNADNATAYPRDGYKDGYYYMRFAARAEDVSFYYPGLSAKNVRDAIIEVVKTGGNGSGSAMSVIEVEELPPTGIKGVFYIVKKPDDTDASEYLWLDRWEKVGGAVENSEQTAEQGVYVLELSDDETNAQANSDAITAAVAEHKTVMLTPGKYPVMPGFVVNSGVLDLNRANLYSVVYKDTGSLAILSGESPVIRNGRLTGTYDTADDEPGYEFHQTEGLVSSRGSNNALIDEMELYNCWGMAITTKDVWVERVYAGTGEFNLTGYTFKVAAMNIPDDCKYVTAAGAVGYNYIISDTPVDYIFYDADGNRLTSKSGVPRLRISIPTGAKSVSFSVTKRDEVFSPFYVYFTNYTETLTINRTTVAYCHSLALANPCGPTMLSQCRFVGIGKPRPDATGTVRGTTGGIDIEDVQTPELTMSDCHSEDCQNLLLYGGYNAVVTNCTGGSIRSYRGWNLQLDNCRVSLLHVQSAGCPVHVVNTHADELMISKDAYHLVSGDISTNYLHPSLVAFDNFYVDVNDSVNTAEATHGVLRGKIRDCTARGFRSHGWTTAPGSRLEIQKKLYASQKSAYGGVSAYGDTHGLIANFPMLPNGHLIADSEFTISDAWVFNSIDDVKLSGTYRDCVFTLTGGPFVRHFQNKQTKPCELVFDRCTINNADNYLFDFVLFTGSVVEFRDCTITDPEKIIAKTDGITIRYVDTSTPTNGSTIKEATVSVAVGSDPVVLDNTAPEQVVNLAWQVQDARTVPAFTNYFIAKSSIPYPRELKTGYNQFWSATAGQDYPGGTIGDGTATLSINRGGETITVDNTSSTVTVKGGDILSVEGGSVVFQLKVVKTVTDGQGSEFADTIITIFGDSIVDTEIVDTEINATVKAPALIAQKTGATVISLGKGGTGYWRTHESGTAYFQRMAYIPPNTDCLVIYGSVNDCRSSGDGVSIGTATDTIEAGTLAGYINEAINVAQSTAPYAQIALVTPLDYHGIPDDVMEDISNIIVAVAKHRKIKVLDLYHESGFRVDDPAFAAVYCTDYSPDAETYGHPSNLAHEKIIAPELMWLLRRMIF